MRVPMSNELRNYLKQWNDWRLAGAKTNQFSKFIGLCNQQYMIYHPILREELVECFDNEDYPFGEQAYNVIYANRKHEDPTRIQWVIDNLPKPAKENT